MHQDEPQRKWRLLCHGVPYDMRKKIEVLHAFLEATENHGDGRARHHLDAVAEMTKVSKTYAHKVITEYLSTGAIEDTKTEEKALAQARQQYTKLGPEESLVLLALRAEDDQQYLVDYQRKLLEATVPQQVAKIVGSLTSDTILHCAGHCSY